MWFSREYCPGFTKKDSSGKKQCFVVILYASVALVMSFFVPIPSISADELPVEDLYVQSKGGTLREPSQQEQDKVERLFLRVLKGDRSAPVVEEWARLDMRMIRTTHEGRDFTVLIEDENHKHGRGFFVFPEKPDKPIGLFVPHRFTDEMTGAIGLSLARENPFTVIAWNTVKRRGRGEPPENWDLGKLRLSYFVALTRAFAEAIPQGYHVQIHGFVKTKRRTAAADQSDAIVSAGTNHPRAELLRLRDCLQGKGLGRVLVYPTDVRELGATKNISGIVLREMGNRGFVHIEMNVELRKRLKDEREARRAFADCLIRELR